MPRSAASGDIPHQQEVLLAMSALSIAPGQGSTLPAVLTPVLGREAELDQIQDLLDDATRRLVTLTGPGGVGKTRLALHVARTLVDEFMRDVIFVPLAAIRDPNLVLPSIGQAMGLSMDTGEAHDERLVSILRDRTPLLVLDNFEHLLDAAPAIADVLAQSPGTKMLVTSQAPLGITGEQLYPLLPLPTPSVNETSARVDPSLRCRRPVRGPGTCSQAHPGYR